MASDNQNPLNKPFSYRVPAPYREQFMDIIAVSRRNKASLLHEALERELPNFEIRYSKELAKYRAAKKKGAAK